MDAKLVVVEGDTKSSEFKLKLPAILGRGRDASLTVPHPLVSRQHCEIFEKDGHLVVRDLGSLNGTFIDNERISEAVLPDGQLLTVGTVTFRAVYCDDPNLSAPAAPAPKKAASRAPGQKDQVAAEPAAPKSEDARVAPSSQSGESGTEEDDAQFAAFLESVDVEGEEGNEKAPALIAEPTEHEEATESPGQTGDDDAVEDVAVEDVEVEDVEVEDVEVEDVEVEDVEVEEVSDSEEVGSDEVEEAEELALPDSGKPPAKPPAKPRAKPPSEAPPDAQAPAKADSGAPSTDDEAPADDDDDGFQAFLRDLGD